MDNFVLEKEFIEVSTELRNNKELWRNQGAFGLLMMIAALADPKTGTYKNDFNRFVKQGRSSAAQAKKFLNFLVSLDLIAVLYEGSNIVVKLKHCKVMGKDNYAN